MNWFNLSFIGWIVVIIALALVADQLLALAGRVATPWTRARSAS